MKKITKFICFSVALCLSLLISINALIPKQQASADSEYSVDFWEIPIDLSMYQLANVSGSVVKYNSISKYPMTFKVDSKGNYWFSTQTRNSSTGEITYSYNNYSINNFYLYNTNTGVYSQFSFVFQVNSSAILSSFVEPKFKKYSIQYIPTLLYSNGVSDITKCLICVVDFFDNADTTRTTQMTFRFNLNTGFSGINYINQTYYVEKLSDYNTLDNAYDLGYSAGLTNGVSDKNSYGQTQYNNGYSVGYSTALTENNDYTFIGLFSALGNTIITPIKGLLNLEILGVNLFSLFSAILTVLLVTLVIKWLMGRGAEK